MNKRVIEIGRLRKRDDSSMENLTIGKIRLIREHFRKLTSQTNQPVTFLFGTVRGGEVDEILDLGEEIIDSGFYTIGHARSKIGSVGIYLFLAMKRRIGHPNGSFLLYPEWYPIRGPIIESIPEKGVPTELLEYVKRTGNRISKILVSRTKLSQESVTKILSFESEYVVFSPKVALEQGIIHELRDS